MRTREIVWGGLAVIAAYGIGRALIRKIDTSTQEQGASAGIKTLLSERNAFAKAEWDGDKEETQKIIANSEKAVILVSNHPNVLEPFMFISELPPRKNLSIIAKSGGERIYGEVFRKNMIPVDTVPRWETKKQKVRRQEKNTQQLEEAVRRLKANGAILIAPDGGNGSGRWMKGSSRLIEEAMEMPEAYLVMAHVPNSTKNEHLNLIFKRRLERSVRISEPINVQTLPIPLYIRNMPQGDKEKLITTSQIMKNYYDDWASRSSTK